MAAVVVSSVDRDRRPLSVTASCAGGDATTAQGFTLCELSAAAAGLRKWEDAQDKDDLESYTDKATLISSHARDVPPQELEYLPPELAGSEAARCASREREI